MSRDFLCLFYDDKLKRFSLKKLLSEFDISFDVYKTNKETQIY